MRSPRHVLTPGDTVYQRTKTKVKLAQLTIAKQKLVVNNIALFGSTTYQRKISIFLKKREENRLILNIACVVINCQRKQ